MITVHVALSDEIRGFFFFFFFSSLFLGGIYFILIFESECIIISGYVMTKFILLKMIGHESCWNSGHIHFRFVWLEI